MLTAQYGAGRPLVSVKAIEHCVLSIFYLPLIAVTVLDLHVQDGPGIPGPTDPLVMSHGARGATRPTNPWHPSFPSLASVQKPWSIL
jgi:hypothetical protein